MTISDATRLTSNGPGSDCDTSVFNSTTTWVRFTSPGGTMIPTSALSGSQCGSLGAGWYAGSMPSVGVRLSGTVNFAYSNNIAWHSITIQVENCGSFYVYGLVSPNACTHRYCTI